MNKGDRVFVFANPKECTGLLYPEPVELEVRVGKWEDGRETWMFRKPHRPSEWQRADFYPCAHSRVRIVNLPGDPEGFEIECVWCGEKLDATIIKAIAAGTVQFE